jgi:hypothetical protein
MRAPALSVGRTHVSIRIDWLIRSLFPEKRAGTSNGVATPITNHQSLVPLLHLPPAELYHRVQELPPSMFATIEMNEMGGVRDYY